MKKLTLLIFSLVCLCSLEVPAKDQVVVYQGATLINGTGNDPVSNARIIVRGDRILAAGSEIEVPENADIVDVTGKWITPGLIDAHVHFMTSGRMYTRPAFFDLTDKVPYEEEIRWIKDHLPDTLRAFSCSGVTGVISMGGPSIEYETRALAATMPDAPTVFNAHGIVGHMPRYLAERMIPPWDGELTLKPVVSKDEALAVVQDALANGAHLIKTAADDRGSHLVSGLMWWWNWQELESTIIEEGAKHGLRVTAHSHALEYSRELMKLGVSSLQHVVADFPVDDAFIQLARDKNIIVVPTLAIRKRTFIELFTKELQLEPIEETCSVPGIIDSWYEPLPAIDEQSTRYRLQGDMAAQNTKTLYDAGVTIAVATDVGMIGLAAGSSMHLELRDLNEAGIPTDYLIHAATFNSARVAGVEDDYGTIEAGKYADFLILAADPIADIANLQKIEQVVKHGQAFNQNELLPPAD